MHGVLAFPGSYAPPKRAGKYKGGGVGPSPCYSYSASVVELSVDEETGEIELHDVWIAHDVGRALNPLLVEGQVEGSVYMGIGEALMEGQVFRKGLHKQPSMLDYKSPTTLETPEIHTILVETDDPEGPFGAKEAGQGPLLPVIPAIANAIYHAIGVRFDEVPITPDMILKGFELKRQGKPARIGPERIPVFRYKEPLVVESAFGQPADAVAERPFGDAAPRAHSHGSVARAPQAAPALGHAPAPPARAPRCCDAHPDQATLGSRRARGSDKCCACRRSAIWRPARWGRPCGSFADAGPETMLVAGGTDLYPNMKRRQFEPKTLVGLRAIPELRGVRGSARRRARHRRGDPAHRRVARIQRSRATTRPWPSPPGWCRRLSSGTWGRSAATSASTRAATTTTRLISGGRPSASA